MQWLLIHSVITSMLAMLLALVFYSIAGKNPALRYARSLYYTYLLASIAFATLAVRGSSYHFDPVLITAILCTACIFAFVMLYIAVAQWQAVELSEERMVRYGILAAAVTVALLYFPSGLSTLALYLTRAVVFVLACEVVYLMLVRAREKNYGTYFAGLFILLIPASLVVSLYHAWTSPQESLTLGFLVSESFQNSRLAILSYAVFPVVIPGTGIFFLMTMMIESVEAARTMAIEDHLTGLYNRRGFAEMARKALDESHRYEIPVSLIMCDIDEFKQVNDTCGHKAGDDALKFIAETLKASTRRTDVLARYGGEEFLVLLTHASPAVAQITAERIRGLIENSLISHEGRVIHYTASFGVAGIDSSEKNLDSAISRVDKALYQAKRGGKNRVCLFRGNTDGNVDSVGRA